MWHGFVTSWWPASWENWNWCWLCFSRPSVISTTVKVLSVYPLVVTSTTSKSCHFSVIYQFMSQDWDQNKIYQEFWTATSHSEKRRLKNHTGEPRTARISAQEVPLQEWKTKGLFLVTLKIRLSTKFPTQKYFKSCKQNRWSKIT